MRNSVWSFPSFAQRVTAGRPVLAQDQMHALGQRILAMSTAPLMEVRMTHTARVATRLANGQILSGDDGDTLEIRIDIGFNGDISQAGYEHRVTLNQPDIAGLQAVIDQCEALAKERIRAPENVSPIKHRVQDEYVPVQLWHDSTIQAMRDARATALPRLLLPVRKAGLMASGFLGLMARSEAYFSRDGITAFSEETDSEVTLTIRGEDGRSGWHGQASRDWSNINIEHVVTHALNIAEQSAHPVAVEPGRRTAILSAEAMGQIARAMTPFFMITSAVFSQGKKIRWGGRYFDPRITITSDPADPEGGYTPFFIAANRTPPMTYIVEGKLKDLSVGGDLARGKPMSLPPSSMRISGGPTSVEQMIAQCSEGIYVNRLYGVKLVDENSGVMTGTTADGCFLIKHGKIEKPIKNFRILDSPIFFLNKLEAIGPTARVALGYVPGATLQWPLPPIIAPPVMVNDFNFNSLVDAV